MQLTPLKDFFSEEFQSQYCVGLSYTVRPQDTKLAALVPKWIADGKVRVGAPDNAAVAAQFSGTGEVK